jgi:hypothetical protein
MKTEIVKIETLCYIGLIAGVIGIIWSLLICCSKSGRVAGAGGLCASAIVIGSGLIALAIAQRTKEE